MLEKLRNTLLQKAESSVIYRYVNSLAFRLSCLVLLAFEALPAIEYGLEVDKRRKTVLP